MTKTAIDKKSDEPAKPAHSKEKLTTSSMMLQAALDMMHKAKIPALLLYVDGLEDIGELEKFAFNKKHKTVLICRSDETFEKAMELTKNVVHVPPVNLTRTGLIKMSVMLSFSQHILKPGDKFVFLSGLTGGHLDTMMIMEIGQEYEMFQSVDQPPLTEHIRRTVFERVLTLALQLAAEGREGKPVGAMFVVGDSSSVKENSRQMIMNPFKGHPEADRNILNETMTETVKEFSSIDGAFIIKGTGTIVSAGTYLLPKLVAEELPQGLGTRHASACAITEATKSIAITISESTGTVRIWRQGKLITEIEKSTRHGN